MLLNETCHIEQLPLSSAKDLLVQHGVDLSVSSFFRTLVMEGYLLELHRPSLTKKSAQKKLYVLTRKGLLFGRNLPSADHPFHSTPRFYGRFFGLLLSQCRLVNGH